MNKLEKMRRLIQESKKYSILYQHQNKQTTRRSTLQKDNRQTQKQKENNISIVSVLNFKTDPQNQSSHPKNQEKNFVDYDSSQTGLSLKLKKVQNYTCSLTLRSHKHLYHDTVENVSSLVAKHVVGDVRINKTQFNRKAMKNLKTRESQEEETQSLENEKKDVAVLMPLKSKTMRRSPKKIAYRTVSKVKRTLSPKRHTSPMKGMRLSGWQVSQQPQFEWQ